MSETETTSSSSGEEQTSDESSSSDEEEIDEGTSNETSRDSVVANNNIETKAVSSGKKRPHKETSDHSGDSQAQITEVEREILLAIGKIKKQKQRPGLERIFNCCRNLKDKHPEFSTTESLDFTLNSAVERGVLVRLDSKGSESYRETGPEGAAIVALTNPPKIKPSSPGSNIEQGSSPIKQVDSRRKSAAKARSFGSPLSSAKSRSIIASPKLFTNSMPYKQGKASSFYEKLFYSLN